MLAQTKNPSPRTEDHSRSSVSQSGVLRLMPRITRGNTPALRKILLHASGYSMGVGSEKVNIMPHATLTLAVSSKRKGRSAACQENKKGTNNDCLKKISGERDKLWSLTDEVLKARTELFEGILDVKQHRS